MYDDDAILLEYDGANALLATYSHGEEVDQPLSMARGGQSYFYQVDHLGSIRLLTDAAGAIVSRYDYDAFGNLESTSFEGIANPYAFTARERDAESGLMFYRARYYDPKVGRFISEDPIGFEANDLNLYRYVYNNPLVWVDPRGTFAFTEYATSHKVMVVAVTGFEGAKIGLLLGLLTEKLIAGEVGCGTAGAGFAGLAGGAGIGASLAFGGLSGVGAATVLAFLGISYALFDIYCDSL